MNRKQMLLAMLLLAAGVMVSGCVAVAVGAGAAGTTAYVMGDLSATENKSVAAVYDAAVKAMDELKLNVIEKRQDDLSAKIIARDSQDKKITIKLKAVSEAVTDISIRVGVFGDRTKSQLIFDKMRANLN